MRAKELERAKARALRAQGLSYNEIQREIHVSKSSISRWCRDIELPERQKKRLASKQEQGLEQGRRRIAERKHVERRKLAEEIRRLYWEEGLSGPQIANRLGMGRQAIYQIMRKEGIPRRSGSEANYLQSSGKPPFEVKGILSSEEEKLRVAGVMLYWAEGAKTGEMVDFSNSDPQMVKLFMMFLRRICGVAEERLRARVYGYSDQSADELESYWSEVTGIPRSQFQKAYIREGNPHRNGRTMEHGLVKIRYYDKRLVKRILDWAGNVSDDLLQLER